MKREDVQELYDRADFHWKKRWKLQDEVETEIQMYNTAILEYRVQSAIRVLEYVLAESINETIDKHEVDQLIEHCIRKLKGRNDGIDIRLGDDK